MDMVVVMVVVVGTVVEIVVVDMGVCDGHGGHGG